MKRLFGSLALLGAMVVGLLTATPARAELVSNGSFELPGIASTQQNGVPTDWTVPANAVAIVRSDFEALDILFKAQDGNQWLDLSGTQDTGGSVEQSVDTAIGQLYKLSFYVGSAAPVLLPSSIVSLGLNNVAAGIYTNLNTMATDPVSGKFLYNWQQFTAFFTATSTSTLLNFNSLSSANHATGIDNVSLTAVPEPATLAIWGLMGGIGAIFATRFNRKRLFRLA